MKPHYTIEGHQVLVEILLKHHAIENDIPEYDGMDIFSIINELDYHTKDEILQEFLFNGYYLRQVLSKSVVYNYYCQLAPNCILQLYKYIGFHLLILIRQ